MSASICFGLLYQSDENYDGDRESNTPPRFPSQNHVHEDQNENENNEDDIYEQIPPLAVGDDPTGSIDQSTN